MPSDIKRIILLGDGMPDEPLKELGGKTPLMVAKTPNMDRMAREGSIGHVKTVPEGFLPGSDITNMGLLGYDPKKYYTGRAPLEAAGMGVPLGPEDVAYRCNLVTLTAGANGVVMQDFSAGHISTGEADPLMAELNNYFANGEIYFHTGVGYRNLMVWKNGKDSAVTVPPHDITGQNVREYLPSGEGGEKLRLITGEAQIALKKHPVNAKRKTDGKNEANSIWLWGQGKAPGLPGLEEVRGITGAMISAVDLMNGLAKLAGMEAIKVEGATGYIDTNYEGKARAAAKALEEKNLVYLHVEAPDEAAHSGLLKDKIRAIEDFDAKIVGPLMEVIAELGGRAMALSDHPTPLATMTHSSDTVPLAIWPGLEGDPHGTSFDESIRKKGSFYEDGPQLFKRFIGRTEK